LAILAIAPVLVLVCFVWGGILLALFIVVKTTFLLFLLVIAAAVDIVVVSVVDHSRARARARKSRKRPLVEASVCGIDITAAHQASPLLC
jgi:hypothetical protein